jgi:hypothetical protein
MELALVLSVSLALVAGTVLVHYEFLRGASTPANHLEILGRTRVLVVLAGALLAHLVEVSLYAGSFYLAKTQWDLGRIDGHIEGGSLDFFYFSITTFTTLGVGDLHPRGPMRLIAGVESLNGLVLIGWSASFTYLAMGQFWKEAPAAPSKD